MLRSEVCCLPILLRPPDYVGFEERDGKVYSHAVWLENGWATYKHSRMVRNGWMLLSTTILRRVNGGGEVDYRGKRRRLVFELSARSERAILTVWKGCRRLKEVVLIRRTG